jgi:thioredoxin-related protein
LAGPAPEIAEERDDRNPIPGYAQRMMTRRFLLLLLILTVTPALLLVAGERKADKPPTKDANGIEWYGYQAGWEKAKAENKHMFIDFTATWCGWCRRLEQNTFSKPPIIKALTEDFIPVKVWEKSTDTLNIDGYIITEQDLRRREFRANSFPQLWFVSPEGARIGPIKGYVTAEQLQKVLDFVKYYHYDSTRDESGKLID